MLKNDERKEKKEEERSTTRAAVSRVIAHGTSNTFAFALLAPASRYLLYHYNCNEMLRDVTDGARARVRSRLLYNGGNRSLIADRD